jgi:thiamine pyrophosphate-dependent acetolactate synthase large subunit-like protein
VLIDNHGYKAIIDSQDAFFDHRFGVNKSTGLSMPNWEGLVSAYGLRYELLESRLDLLELKDLLAKATGPFVLHVAVPSTTPLIPRGGFKEDPSGSLVRRAPWDMYPDLPDFSLGWVIGDGELP